MKFYMSINDLIGWIIILGGGGGVALFVIIWIIASVIEKFHDFKSWREKKKREREANGD